MRRRIFLFLVPWLFCFGINAVQAQCSWTNLTNGQTANADQVMGNFACLAPRDNPTFTGNVGVGTASPSGHGSGAAGPFLDMFKAGNGPEMYIGSDFTTAGGVQGVYGGYTTGSPSADKRGGLIVFSNDGSNAASTNGRIDFYTASGGTLAERMRIDKSGNVGIGTSAPSYILDIAQTLASTSAIRISNNSASSSAVSLILASNGTSNAIFEQLGTGVTPGGMYVPNRSLIGGDGSNGVWFGALGSAAPVFIGYAANSPGITISASGNVGIGTTSPAQALEVNGHFQVNTLASASGTSLCINSNVLSSCSSSIRYKEQIKDAPFGLREISLMRPVTFKWRDRAEQDFGLIAEEVAAINPLFVTRKNGKIEGVKYPQLAALLIAAVKQQQAEIAALETQNAELQSRLLRLEQRVSLRIAGR